jgi:hypothetical protein
MPVAEFEEKQYEIAAAIEWLRPASRHGTP